MEIRWLEDFIALARTRHFSRAAEEQHVTQPTFSRRIKLLEEEMGVTLINRQTLPLSLTPAGEEFLTLCEQVTERVRLTRDRMRDIHAGQAQRVLVAAPQSLLANFFADWAGELGWGERLQPYLRATGWVASDYFQALQRGECDLAICYWPTERCELDLDTTACHFRTIGSERLIAVTAPNAEGTPRVALPGTRQQPLPWLAYPKRGLLGSAIKAHLSRRPVAAHLVAQTENLYAPSIKELIQLGYGMSWLPERSVARELDEGTLVRAGGREWDVALELRLYRHQKPHGEVDQLWSTLAARQPRHTS